MLLVARILVGSQESRYSPRVRDRPDKEGGDMQYDLLIKNGLLVDGSGQPGYYGDVAIAQGYIAAMGKVDGPATGGH